jgi:hypothetical protein
LVFAAGRPEADIAGQNRIGGREDRAEQQRRGERQAHRNRAERRDRSDRQWHHNEQQCGDHAL